LYSYLLYIFIQFSVHFQYLCAYIYLKGIYLSLSRAGLAAHEKIASPFLFHGQPRNSAIMDSYIIT